MIKTMTVAELRNAYTQIFQKWEQEKNNIRIPAKSLYNLIAMKKKMETEFFSVNEAIATILLQEGCTDNGDGSFNIPEEKRVEVGKKMEDFSKETVEFEYTPIVVGEDDSLPPAIFEGLFDFIEMK